MTKVSVSTATLDRLSDDAIEFARTLVDLLSTAPEVNQRMPIVGTDQAIDAFMEEREVLKDELDDLRRANFVLTQSLEAGVQQLNQHEANEKAMTAVLVKVAKLVGTLRDRLGSIGIVFVPDEAGEALVTIDAPTLFGAFNAAQAA